MGGSWCLLAFLCVGTFAQLCSFVDTQTNCFYDLSSLQSRFYSLVTLSNGGLANYTVAICESYNGNVSVSQTIVNNGEIYAIGRLSALFTQETNPPAGPGSSVCALSLFLTSC